MKHLHNSILALLLVMVMMLSFTACDLSTIVDISGDTGEGTKEIVPDDGTNNGGGDLESGSPFDPENGGDDSMKLPAIEENLLFEYNGITVTAKEIVDDTFWGAGIKVHIENNTETDYQIGVEEAIVNHCMVGDLFSCTVAAGKKANDTIYLLSSDLKASGIENIGLVELYFYVSDPTTYERIYETGCITIKTSDYDQMDTTVEDAGQTLYEDNGIQIVGKYVEEYKLYGKAIVLYIANNREDNVTVSCTDMSINGYMVTPFLFSTVYAGRYAIDEIAILDSDLDENDITKIENFALKFEVFHADTYRTILKTDELSFTVK